MIEEIEELARTAGYEPAALLTQSYLWRAKFGVGPGKAEEVARIVKEKAVNVIIFDSKLKSTQAYNLAKLCQVEVKDREKIILEIFEKRAASAEAKLQVQLAELIYELPESRNRVRMAKMGEQPGFFGLGKYEVDVYVRMMKKRVSTLKEKVREIRKRREIFRERRTSSSLPTIALTGYTASGKTTLFNRLTGERKDVSQGVFTTLSPTTRAITINNRKVLLTDTVGFISNLPTYMIEAFRSTLEEISYASVVLLLIDASQPEEKFLRNFRNSLEFITDLAVDLSKTILVLNKCDLADTELIKKRRNIVTNAITISAKTGYGIPELMMLMESKISTKSREEERNAIIER
jgi:GTP-binding protein HflX